MWMHGRRVARWNAHEQDQRSLWTEIAYFLPGRLSEATSKRVGDTERIWSPRATIASAGVRSSSQGARRSAEEMGSTGERTTYSPELLSIPMEAERWGESLVSDNLPDSIVPPSAGGAPGCREIDRPSVCRTLPIRIGTCSRHGISLESARRPPAN